MSRLYRVLSLLPVVVAGVACAAEPATRSGPVKRKDAWLALLKQPMTVKFDNTPVSEALEFCRDISGMGISVDWRRLETAGVKRDTPIRFRGQRMPFGHMLRLILRATGGKITYVLGDGKVEIVPEGPGRVWPLANDPEERAANAATEKRLASMIRNSKCRDVPLDLMLQFLGESTEADIFVDWHALGAVGVNRKTLISLAFATNRAEFREVLRATLQSAGPDLEYTLEWGTIIIAPRPAKPTTMPSKPEP